MIADGDETGQIFHGDEAYTGPGRLEQPLHPDEHRRGEGRDHRTAEHEGLGQGYDCLAPALISVSRQRATGGRRSPSSIARPARPGAPCSKAQLPVVLPEDADFGAWHPPDRHLTWKHAACLTCGGEVVRETDTLDTFVDLSVFPRFPRRTADRPFDADVIRRWPPVDYIAASSMRSSTCSTRASWTRAQQAGMIDIKEFSASLFTQGMVTHENLQPCAGRGSAPSSSPPTRWRTADGATLRPMARRSRSAASSRCRSRRRMSSIPTPSSTMAPTRAGFDALRQPA